MSENPQYPSGRVHADGVVLSSRRRFVAKVYTLVIVYIILTCIQTLPILFVQDARDFLKEQRNLIYIVLVFFVMTVLLFFNFHDVRVVSPYNIIILLLLLESATFVIMIMVAPFDERDIALSFGTSAAICITVSFIAAITTCDITRQIIFLMLWLILLFVVSTIIIVVTIFKPSKELMIAFSVFAISGVVVFLFYHTQTVIGGRIAQIRMRRLSQGTQNEAFESVELPGQRKFFIIKVYSAAGGSLALTMFQVLLLILIKESQEFLKSKFYLFYVGAILFMTVNFMFLFVNIIRTSLPAKILFLILSIESAVLFLSVWCAMNEASIIGYSFATTVLVFIILTGLSAICPLDVTKYIDVLIFIKIVVSLSCLILLLVYIFERIRVLLIPLAYLLMLYISLFVVYVTQLIFGGRSARLEIKEDLFGAYHIYNYFVFIFVAILHLYAEPRS